MQLSSTPDDPDRACKVACQDSSISYRFYMVSESKGWFPAGTDCSGGEGQTKYCVKGRCLEFGQDDTPLYLQQTNDDNNNNNNESNNNIFRTRRSLVLNSTSRIAGSIDQTLLEQLVLEFNRTIQQDETSEPTTTTSSTTTTVDTQLNFKDPVDVPDVERYLDNESQSPQRPLYQDPQSLLDPNTAPTSSSNDDIELINDMAILFSHDILPLLDKQENVGSSSHKLSFHPILPCIIFYWLVHFVFPS